MAKAKKLPSGNYRCRARYTDADGVQHSASFTDASAKVAEAQAAMWKAGMIERDNDRKDMTLGDAIDAYIQTLEASGRSPATIREYISRRKSSFGLIKNKRLSKLTVNDIQRQVNDRMDSVSPKTVYNDLAVLSATLNLYKPELNLKKLKLPEVDKKETIIPTEKELASILNKAESDSALYCAILLSAFTALRRSEICALEWKDLDVENKRLSVTKAMVLDKNNCWVIKKPKKKSSTRFISIEPVVIEELLKHRSDFRRIVDAAPNEVTERCRKICDSLNLPQIHLHTLRHYKASFLLCMGLTATTVGKYLGHSTDHMVQNVYGHLTRGFVSEVEQKASSHAESVLNGKKLIFLPQELPQELPQDAK